MHGFALHECSNSSDITHYTRGSNVGQAGNTVDPQIGWKCSHWIWNCTTILAQIKWNCFFCPKVFGAITFKFKPKMTAALMKTIIVFALVWYLNAKNCTILRNCTNLQSKIKFFYLNHTIAKSHYLNLPYWRTQSI